MVVGNHEGGWVGVGYVRMALFNLLYETKDPAEPKGFLCFIET